MAKKPEPSNLSKREHSFRDYGMWIFSLLFFAFFVAAFFSQPPNLDPNRQRMVAIASGALIGLLAYFMTGKIALSLGSESKLGRIEVKAVGGLACFVFVLWWWYRSPTFAFQNESGKIIEPSEFEGFVLRDNPTNAHAWIVVGRPRNDYERALAAIASNRLEYATQYLAVVAASLERELGRVYLLHGRAKVILGHYSNAVPFLSKALETSPSETESAIAVADAQLRAARYDDAEALYLEIKKELERRNEQYTANYGQVLNDLAWIFRETGRQTEAENLMKTALNLREVIYERSGSIKDENLLAESLNNLAMLYAGPEMNRLQDAEKLQERATGIWLRVQGPQSHGAALGNQNLGKIYRLQERYSEAEKAFLRALKIWQTLVPLDHPDRAATLEGLAMVYALTGRALEARQHFKEALTIRTRHLGASHPLTRSLHSNFQQFFAANGSL